MFTVQNVGRSESGQYFCQPSIGPQHSVMVHVLDRYTDVLPVLGEGMVHVLDRYTDVLPVLGEGIVHVLDRYTDVLPVLGEGKVHDLDIQMYSLYLEKV